MGRKRAVVGVVSGLAVVAAAAPSAEAKVVSFSGTNASGTVLTVCGASQSVEQRLYDQGAVAQVQGAKTKKGRKKRKGTTIAIDKCVGGAWKQVSSQKMGARKKAKAVPFSTSRANHGDYRIRLLKKSNQVGAPAYLRVGVGETVDLPISFQVQNTNKTNVPCGVGTPDDKTYTVKGTITAPRSSLIGQANRLKVGSAGDGVGLYLHGFGYRGYFFRLPIPGYDYGAEQAADGHTSVVVDRLGYGSSPGPKDGNKICIASQATMADQMVKALRSGNYTMGGGRGAAFGQVALIGHSAGGAIAEMAQGALQSADALVMIGFNNTVPGALAVQQLGTQTADCTQGGGPGENDSDHYAAFGRTDADYAKGHLYNVDPAVEKYALNSRSTEPCGDVISITPTMAYLQGAVRAIRVHSLLVAGDHDAFFPLPGAPSQQQAQQLFSPFAQPQGVEIIKDAGHAVTMARTHDSEFRTKINKFLDLYGF